MVKEIFSLGNISIVLIFFFKFVMPLNLPNPFNNLGCDIFLSRLYSIIYKFSFIAII